MASISSLRRLSASAFSRSKRYLLASTVSLAAAVTFCASTSSPLLSEAFATNNSLTTSPLIRDVPRSKYPKQLDQFVRSPSAPLSENAIRLLRDYLICAVWDDQIVVDVSSASLSSVPDNVKCNVIKLGMRELAASHGDLPQTIQPNSVDTIVCTINTDFVSTPVALVEHAAAALKPGGNVFFVFNDDASRSQRVAAYFHAVNDAYKSKLQQLNRPTSDANDLHVGNLFYHVEEVQLSNGDERLNVIQARRSDEPLTL